MLISHLIEYSQNLSLTTSECVFFSDPIRILNIWVYLHVAYTMV